MPKFLRIFILAAALFTLRLFMFVFNSAHAQENAIDLHDYSRVVAEVTAEFKVPDLFARSMQERFSRVFATELLNQQKLYPKSFLSFFNDNEKSDLRRFYSKSEMDVLSETLVISLDINPAFEEKHETSVAVFFAYYYSPSLLFGVYSAIETAPPLEQLIQIGEEVLKRLIGSSKVIWAEARFAVGDFFHSTLVHEASHVLTFEMGNKLTFNSERAKEKKAVALEFGEETTKKDAFYFNFYPEIEIRGNLDQYRYLKEILHKDDVETFSILMGKHDRSNVKFERKELEYLKLLLARSKQQPLSASTGRIQEF